MKLFKKKEIEEKEKMTLEAGEKRHKELQHEIDELKNFDYTFCPIMRTAFTFHGLIEIHNSTLHVAIQERMDKLISLQEDIEI